MSVSRDRLAAVLLVCLLVPATAAATAAPTGGTTAHSSPAARSLAPTPAADGAGALSPPGFEQLDFDADSTDVRVALHENGSATWTVSYALELRTENDTEAFQRLQDDVAANTSAYVDAFASGIRATVSDASNATGREMSATGFSVATDYDAIQRRGYVTYEFTWRGFASKTGQRLVAGDALAGFFLSSDTKLTVAWPEGYDLDTVDPPAAEGDHSVTWRGDSTTFGADGPRVVLASGGGGGGGLSPTTLGAVLAGLALVVLGVGVAYRRRERGAGDGDGDAGGEESDAPVAADEPADEETPPELLSNEERVRRLLESRGGRVKQQEVVSELDWTAAKTSQVVNEMHENGELEKFRLGRENVLKLPEEGDEE